MPIAPHRPCKHPRCASLALPGSGYCAAHQAAHQQARAQSQQVFDARRGSSAARGYDHDWDRESRAFRARFPFSAGFLTATSLWTPFLAQEFHALREIAVEQGTYAVFFTARGGGRRWLEEFPIYQFHAGAIEPTAQVDHIRPVAGPADPLFYAAWNWQALSASQHSTKTATHDGGFRGAPAAQL